MARQGEQLEYETEQAHGQLLARIRRMKVQI